MTHSQLSAIVSQILGVTYFIAWSLSFYPQLILNYKRKSVQGLSLDFVYLNVLGFFCLAIFTTFTISTSKTVRWNDLLFALHALVITILTAIQTRFYKRDPEQTVSKPTRILLILASGSILVMLLAVQLKALRFIDFLYVLSLFKVVISAIKYIPQAWLNYSNKSTRGWSIENILLDFSGGILSLSQLVLDSYLGDDILAIFTNPAKLGLALLSMGFDVIFVLQHFILYRASNVIVEGNGVDEQSRLIGG